MPHNDAEKHAEGHVVFYPGQERRIANLDEMRFTLNGKDEHAGGRPAGSHSSGEVPESGKGSDKSDHVCTITMGIIGNEPMPFLVIFPSQAKDLKNYKINTKNILNRVIYLETVAAVPGMVAAIVRHFKSLRTMQRDGGLLQMFLEEANNERMQ